MVLARDIPMSVTIHRVLSDADPHPWPLPRLDGGVLNALRMYEAGLQLLRADGRAGVILASGPPFHSFVAARWLARRAGCRLVLDYRDEWTESPHGFNRSDQVNRRWEARCLADADLVLFTTPSQLEHQVAAFPGLDRHKCAVVYNGWEPEDFAGRTTASAADRPRGHRRAMTFVGNLGPWFEIEAFLADVVSAIGLRPELGERWSLRFVGRIHPSVRSAIDRCGSKLPIALIGEVEKREACRAMQDADVLLMPNPSRLQRYIPGKIYEYIAAGRPILVHGTGGEMQEIVESLGAGVVVPHGNSAFLAQTLDSIEVSFRSDGARRQEWLAARTRATAARQLFGLLDGLLGIRSAPEPAPSNCGALAP